jgi:hypothetical protein
MGVLFGSGKKAAKKQAAATLLAAENQAKADRVVARGAQQTQETLIAQKKASEDASNLLNVPQDVIDVNLSTSASNSQIDPATGRRRNNRASFFNTKPTGSGIKIA